MENHQNETQKVLETTSESKRERRAQRHRIKRMKHKDLFERLIKLQQRESQSDAFQVIYPAGTNARNNTRLYYSIRKMLNDGGEQKDETRIWKKSLNPEEVHFSIPVMENVEELTLIRLKEGELTLCVPTSRRIRMRIHVARGDLEIKESRLGQIRSTRISKFTSIEILPKDLRLRRLTFTLTGVQAAILTEKIETPMTEDEEKKRMKTRLDLLLDEERRPIRQRSATPKLTYERMKKKHRNACLISSCGGNSQIYILDTESIPEPSMYQRGPVQSRNPISYLRNPMTVEEIRQRILFLDCEFVGGHKEMVGTKLKGTQLLASIAIMDYQGRVILDTRVTPSKKIKSYCRWITGFRPVDLVNQRKEEEIIKEVNVLIRGRILIGHDLTSDLKVLRTNPEDIAGIRDLSTSLVLRELIPSENPRLSLKDVALKILGKELRSSKQVNGKEEPEPHSALEDVKAIREIYLKIEMNWRDTSVEL